MTVNEVLNKNKMTEDNLYPVDYEQYCEFDDVEKRWYLQQLRERFNATDDMIATMMDVSRTTISRWAKRLGMEERCKKADVDRPKKEYFAWLEQWRGESPGLDWAKDEAEETEDTTKGSLTVYGTLGDVAAMLQALAVRDGRRYTVKVEWGCGV